MANVFIAIVYAVLAILSIGVVGYLVILWSHPDEKGDKNMMVYQGIVVAWFSIRLLASLWEYSRLL